MNPITLTFGNYTKKLRLKTPCFFIIGDMQGGDKMACSAVCYSDKINRLCCKCDIKGEHSGDPYVVCNQIKMEKFKNWLKYLHLTLNPSIKVNRHQILF